METPTALPSLSEKTSDTLLGEVRETHASDDVRAVDLKPILQIMDKILHDVGVINEKNGGNVTLKKNTTLPPFDHGMLEAILSDVHNVSGELSCNCPGGEDAHATTLKLLETLKTYSWNAKVVLALAAFTANLGEYWLLLQRGNANSLASSVAFLRQVPEIERMNALREEVTKLVQAIRNLAMLNAKFVMKLHCWYFSKDTQPISDANLEITRAAYWTIHSFVRMASLLGLRNKNTSLTTEAGKALTIQLENEVSQIYDILKHHYNSCKVYIGKEQRPGGGDIVAILNRFLCGQGIDKVDIDKLRCKNVLFLITDLDISLEEIRLLNELYEKTDKYEIVWLPVVDGLYDKQKFMELKAHMKWYTDVPFLNRRSSSDVTCQNALPLLWTWGNAAFPFTAETEKKLWHDRYGWRLDFLFDDVVDPEIRKWIAEGKLICLYGGGTMDWIQQFTTGIKVGFARIGVTVEMVYLGKNNDKEWTGNVIKKLPGHSHNLRVLQSERLFWARLRSMLYLYTRMSQGKTLRKHDPLMQEATKILAYDAGEGGRALLCKGAEVIVRLKGETALNIIWKYGDWENYAKRYGFLEGLGYYMEDQIIPHSCVQFKLPFVSSEIPGKLECCECGRQMEMYYMYRCLQE
ncbi:hypothetical protein V6N13_044438 [Hibiscus sabdariffa]|uniref:Uncharacterized protein n=2 Tax=Hibiscus sabdariffa TaxID=183260 RepID=A0ABR1Z6R5_9ROSI